MDVDTMGAGRELDALVAEKVMAFTWYMHHPDQNTTMPGQRFLMSPAFRAQFSDDSTFFERVFVPAPPDAPVWIPGEGEGDIPAYSTDIAAAWDVIRALCTRIRGHRHSIEVTPLRWLVVFGQDAYDGPESVASAIGYTASLAICRAALKAVAAQHDQ